MGISNSLFVTVSFMIYSLVHSLCWFLKRTYQGRKAVTHLCEQNTLFKNKIHLKYKNKILSSSGLLNYPPQKLFKCQTLLQPQCRGFESWLPLC